jgi:hypothetical protein
VIELYEKRDHAAVQLVFDEIEGFLIGGSELREWVALEFLEPMRELASWKPYGSDVFLRFLGPECRRIWERLDWVSELNVNDCGFLEAEVLIWRVIRERLSPTAERAS